MVDSESKTCVVLFVFFLFSHLLQMHNFPTVDPSILELLQLKLTVGGHIKQLPLSSSVEDGQIVCNKVKHFIVEVYHLQHSSLGC